MILTYGTSCSNGYQRCQYAVRLGGWTRPPIAKSQLNKYLIHNRSIVDYLCGSADFWIKGYGRDRDSFRSLIYLYEDLYPYSVVDEFTDFSEMKKLMRMS